MKKPSGMPQIESRVRRKRKVGSGAPLKVTTAPPAPKTVKASRQTYYQLFAPRLTFNPWKTERDWRASRPKFFALLVMLVLGFGIYQLFSADEFYVGQVEASGTRLLTRAEINQAAAAQGFNLFYVNPSEVAIALEKLPEVKAAHVTLELPNRVLARIDERVPRFVWQTRGGTYWVDDDGVALRVRGNYAGALTMRDLDSAKVQVGARVNADAFNAAVSLRNAWNNGPRDFEWTKLHGLTVKESHGWLVYFGNANQMPEKVSALKVVTDQILRDKRAVEFIDLGNGLPYYRELVAKK